jgi:hypothetical protein
MAKKKSKVPLILGIMIIIGILLFTPVLDIIGLTTPQLCSETPFHPDCACPLGMERAHGGFPPQYVCFIDDYPAEESTECTWINKECVNWKLWGSIYGSIAETDRTPPSGRSCQAIDGFCVNVPFEYKEGLVTFCTDDDWYKFVEEFPGTGRELNSYLEEHCQGTYWNDGCELRYGTPTSLWDKYLENTSGEESNVVFECLSMCKDPDGTIVGGKVLYSHIYGIIDGEIVEPKYIDTGCYNQIEGISCCYNDGFENPFA